MAANIWRFCDRIWGLCLACCSIIIVAAVWSIVNVASRLPWFLAVACPALTQLISLYIDWMNVVTGSQLRFCKCAHAKSCVCLCNDFQHSLALAIAALSLALVSSLASQVSGSPD